MASPLIWHGERVGLVGPNGAGKSVLFRCILGAGRRGTSLAINNNDLLDSPESAQFQRPRVLIEEPDGGEIRLGPSVSVGYYAQQHETLHPEWTVVQEIRDLKPMYESDAYGFLGHFLFDYEAAQKKVGT